MPPWRRARRAPAPRLRVAEAMLACGLDAEAAAVLHVAMQDDPAARSDPAVSGLAAMAAWLSARAGGVQPPPPDFDSAALGTSDEATLWRALWGAGGTDAAAAAGAVAPRWRLLLDYPEHLRRPVLSAVADLLASGGQDQALDALLAAFPDPTLDLARARRLQSQSKTKDSLAVLDRLRRRPGSPAARPSPGNRHGASSRRSPADSGHRGRCAGPPVLRLARRGPGIAAAAARGGSARAIGRLAPVPGAFA